MNTLMMGTWEQALGYIKTKVNPELISDMAMHSIWRELTNLTTKIHTQRIETIAIQQIIKPLPVELCKHHSTMCKHNISNATDKCDCCGTPIKIGKKCKCCTSLAITTA